MHGIITGMQELGRGSEVVNRKEYSGGVGTGCIIVSPRQHRYLLMIKGQYSECTYLAHNFAFKIIKNDQVLARKRPPKR